MPAGSSAERQGAEGLKRMLESRGVMPTDYDDWRKIEETESANARPGIPAREVRPSASIGMDALRPLRRLLAFPRAPHLSSRSLGSRRDARRLGRVPVGE